MLKITIPAIDGVEQFDEEKQEFVYTEPVKEQTLELEHSLVSLSKWESKWCKPFLKKEELSYEENIDYIRCMTITKNVNPDIYFNLTSENISEIEKYIANPMTATKIRSIGNGKSNKELLTSELIYYYMINNGIPFECEKWHLNRLITLINVCCVKNEPPKKMSRQEVMSRNAALNASRRQQLNSRG